MHDGEWRRELERKKGQRITMRMRAFRTNALDRKEGQMRCVGKVNVREREKEDMQATLGR